MDQPFLKTPEGIGEDRAHQRCLWAPVGETRPRAVELFGGHADIREQLVQSLLVVGHGPPEGCRRGRGETQAVSRGACGLHGDLLCTGNARWDGLRWRGETELWPPTARAVKPATFSERRFSGQSLTRSEDSA